MKALIYMGPNTLAYGDVAAPVAAAGEVLVRVEAVGICGSDMHAYHGHDARRPSPFVLGHEAAGRIVTGPRRGECVTIDPLVICGACVFCLSGRSQLCAQRQIISMPPRPGAFAELVSIPERNVVAVPTGLEVTKAALAEPVAVAWHAVRLGVAALGRPLAASRSTVLGGGAIGVAAALVLSHFGAREVALAESNALRRETAVRAGPLNPYAPGAAGEPKDSSIDLIVDAVGAKATREAASRLVRPGGVIVHVGLLPGAEGLDIRKFTLHEITLIGSYAYTHLDFLEAIAALGAGHLGPLTWLTQRPLAAGSQAFQDLDAGTVAAAKIVLRP
ncbi:MAG: zinc-dependent alcohol dehydrogenase [Acetobacteraceae bacterium]